MAHIKRIAWTGGSRPVKLMGCMQIERNLRTRLFREQMQTVHTFWGDYVGLCGSVLEQARTQYRYAKYDAHATVRV